jgi:hypothetical protein
VNKYMGVMSCYRLWWIVEAFSLFESTQKMKKYNFQQYYISHHVNAFTNKSTGTCDFVNDPFWLRKIIVY